MRPAGFVHVAQSAPSPAALALFPLEVVQAIVAKAYRAAVAGRELCSDTPWEPGDELMTPGAFESLLRGYIEAGCWLRLVREGEELDDGSQWNIPLLARRLVPGFSCPEMNDLPGGENAPDNAENGGRLDG